MSDELPPAPGGFAVGSRLAGYRCEEEIGRGGMAVVYRAYDDHLDRRVALKVLAPELARDDVFRARFIQESRIAAATEHPNIIPVFNAGEADGVLYIAMRYVPDGDVRSLIDRVGPLPVARACALISQAASALDAAHARGLVHRDVKPTNMLLEISNRTSRPDHLYLSDFGLAKPSSAASGLTMTGQFFGTVDYVAPEQIQSQPLDGRTDQYALACASFEMLCGVPPFKRENGMAVISAQLSEPPPLLSSRRHEVPPAADAVIAKALSKSPADRYERCLDFAEALLAACRSGPAGAGLPPAAGAAHPPTQVAMPVAPVVPPTRADAGAAGSPAQPPAMAGYSGTPPVGIPRPVGPAAGEQTVGAGFAGPPPARTAQDLPPTMLPPTMLPPAGQQQPASAGLWGGGQAWPPQAGGPGMPGQPGMGDWGTPPRPPRRRRGAVAAGVIAILVVLFFAAAGVTYLMLHRTGNGTPTAAGSSTPAVSASGSTSAAANPATAGGPTSAATGSPASSAPVNPPPPGDPVATVRAYYSAINTHHYARAWRLGGRNTGSTYHNFVAGFAGTAHDQVIIQSFSGNTVNAQINARQTDGTVKVYQGTYVVTNGVITQFSVQQTG